MEFRRSDNTRVAPGKARMGPNYADDASGSTSQAGSRSPAPGSANAALDVGTASASASSVSAAHGGSLVAALRGVPARFLVIAFSSDWLYPPYQSKELVAALNANQLAASYVEIKSSYGHDAFLLEEPELFATIRGFLNAAAAKRGLSLGAGSS